MFKLGAGVLFSAATFSPPHLIPPPNLAARATRHYCFAHRGAGNPQASCSLNTRACPLKPRAYRCIDYYTITYRASSPRVVLVGCCCIFPAIVRVRLA